MAMRAVGDEQWPALDDVSEPEPQAALAEDRERADTEHFLELFRTGLFVLGVDAIASAGLAAIVWEHADPRRAAIWLVMVWGVAALRTLLWRGFKQLGPQFRSLQDWAMASVASMVVAGAVWGSAVALLWVPDKPELQMLLILSVPATSALVAIMLSGYLVASVMCYLTSLAFTLLSLIWVDAENAILFAGIVLTVSVAGLTLVLHVNTVVRRNQALSSQLAEAKEMAQAAAEAKSSFVANMSHELRTPLNAIIGFSELIKNQVYGPIKDGRYTDYASDIHESGGHLLDIINDILDLSKIEAGKMELQEDLVDVCHLIDKSVTLVRTSADNAGINIEVDCPDGMPSVVGDARCLKQVLLNLLSNAVKFTPLGGTVFIDARRVVSGDLLILVKDDGIGMAPEDVATAFEPFGQVESPMARRYEGTGLGLPLVKSMIELHGGQLILESELGMGTTASVYLPKERVSPKGARSGSFAATEQEPPASECRVNE